MTERTCSIDGCERPSRKRGWCSTHYSRWKRHGDPNGRPVRPGPLTPGVIPLTKGYEAIVDVEDHDRVAALRWYAQVTATGVYGMRRDGGPGEKVNTQLHRFVLGLPPWEPGGVEVDHINRDTLDNRKANLRVVTHQGNAMNRADNRRPRSCAVCSSEFTPEHPQQTFCSLSCSAVNRTRQAQRDEAGRFSSRAIGAR